MILRSLTEIRETFGVGERQVKLWARAGAPIAVEGEGPKTRYSAEAARLQAWREDCRERAEKRVFGRSDPPV